MTDRQAATRRGPRRQAPWPLLAAMASLMVVFLLAALLTGEWGFLAIGLVGFTIGLLPLVSKR